MRPEGRTVSSPVRRSWWSTRLASGSLTSLAAVSLVSALSAVPAAAQGLNAEPPSTVVSTDRGSLPSADPAPDRDRDKDKDRDRDRDKDKDNDGDGPEPPTPPAVDGCFEIDTNRMEGGMAFYSAVSDGRVYVADEEGVPLGPLDWFDITELPGEAPVNPCGTSIGVGPVDGSDVVVDVITTAGTVHTITCTRVMGSQIGTCDTWEQRETPTPGDVLGP